MKFSVVALLALLSVSALAQDNCFVGVNDSANSISYELSARIVGNTDKSVFPKVFEVTWTDKKNGKVFSKEADIFETANSKIMSNGEFLFSSTTYSQMMSEWSKDVAELRKNGKADSYFELDTKNTTCGDEELSLVMFLYYAYLH